MLILLSKALPIYFFSVNYISPQFFIFVANVFICLCLLIVSSEVFIFSEHYAFIFFRFIVSPMDLHLVSRFGLVTWLVMSNSATLKCSRPDSKGNDCAGRYLMLPKVTEPAKGGG